MRNKIVIYLHFHFLLDPDPGKSSGSIRIRIRNTLLFWMKQASSLKVLGLGLYTAVFTNRLSPLVFEPQLVRFRGGGRKWGYNLFYFYG